MAGLPAPVRPGHLLVRLCQAASFAAPVINVEFEWDGGPRAAFKADFDESQDFMPFPDPTWGWISSRGPVVLAQTDFEDGPQAFRFAMDPPMASIEDRETWVRLARMVTGAPYTGGAVEEYTRLGSVHEWGRHRCRPVAGPAPTMVLRHRIGGPESDRRSLLRAGERGLHLVLGLPEGPLGLWPERPTPWSVRYLDRGTPVRAVVTLGRPQWCTFVIEPLDTTDRGSDSRAGRVWLIGGPCSLPSRARCATSRTARDGSRRLSPRLPRTRTRMGSPYHQVGSWRSCGH